MTPSQLRASDVHPSPGDHVPERLGLAQGRSLRHEPRDWLIVAWALWWSWAYIQGALAHRFPHLLGWTRHLW